MLQCLLVTFSLVPEIPTLFSACLSPSWLTKSSHFLIFGSCFHTFFREGLGTVYLSLVGNCFIGYVFLTKYKILSFSSLNCEILEDRETTTFFFKVTFIYLCLPGLGLCCCLSRVAASRGRSGCGGQASPRSGFSWGGARPRGPVGSGPAGPGSSAQAQQSWPLGLSALQHVGASQTRGGHVSCTGRRIL